MTPWTQGLWTRRASCTSCLGRTTSSTWRVTGCPPAPSKRCEEREHLTHQTNNNRKHIFCRRTNKPYLVCVLQSVLLHPSVVDCAVVGLEDPLKGHVPLALCVLRNGEESIENICCVLAKRCHSPLFFCKVA